MGEKLLIATGDIGPNRDNPDEIFDGVRDALGQADLLFGQLEPCIAHTGTPAAQCRLPMRCRPESAAAIRRAGYDVISFATNHCMDWGRPAFFETLELLRAQGIRTIGAGEDIFAARRPAVVDLDGTKIGFLGYNSILPQDYWANEERPGCAPLRGITAAVPREHDQPETPVRLFSWPHPDDLDAMLDDIARLRPQVDVLIVSFHWGIHFVPAVLAQYQRYAAHFAIDAGADLILGHHTHILKPMEVYKGKAIIYSMANFALEEPGRFFEGKGDLTESKSHQDIAALNPDMKKSKRQMPADSYKTLYVKCVIDEKRIKRVSFVPVQLDAEAVPHTLTPDDPRFGEIVDYMRQITADQKLDTRYAVDGGEVCLICG